MRALQVEWKVCGEDCGPRSAQSKDKGGKKKEDTENPNQMHLSK